MTIKHLIDENFSPKPREQQGHYFIEFALAFDPTQNLIVQERVMLSEASQSAASRTRLSVWHFRNDSWKRRLYFYSHRFRPRLGPKVHKTN